MNSTPEMRGQMCARCIKPMLPLEEDRIKIGRFTYCAGCAEKVKKEQANASSGINSGGPGR